MAAKYSSILRTMTRPSILGTMTRLSIKETITAENMIRSSAKDKVFQQGDHD